MDKGKLPRDSLFPASLRSAILPGMLTLLRVKNLALVEEASVAFEPGLNIVTGETGAGKSILIGALYLLLGERADTSAVRAGESQCLVEATFHLAHPQAVERRAGGRRARPLRGRAAHAAPHGEGRRRRAGVRQRRARDPAAAQAPRRGAGGPARTARPPVAVPARQPSSTSSTPTPRPRKSARPTPPSYAKWQALLARREELSADVGDLDAQIDLLAYRVKEIEEAAPVEGEEEKVRAEQQTAGHAQRILELGQLVVQAVSEDETRRCPPSPRRARRSTNSPA
jgi:DNA repair protein RecN (Recombination protein N)